MMKALKCTVIVILFFLLTSFSVLKEYDAVLYMLPRNDETLCAVKKKIYASDNADFCEKMILEMTSQKNSSYIPLVAQNTKTSVEKSTAVVDFSSSTLPREIETIYSLVNSLTSTGDIITVEFTVNGEKKADFFKNTSIYETFIPDYNI